MGVGTSLSVLQGPGPQALRTGSHAGSDGTHQPPDHFKSAIYAGEQTGPLSGQQAGFVSGLDEAVGASEYDRENHPWHYWLNRSKSSQQRWATVATGPHGPAQWQKWPILCPLLADGGDPLQSTSHIHRHHQRSGTYEDAKRRPATADASARRSVIPVPADFQKTVREGASSSWAFPQTFPR